MKKFFLIVLLVIIAAASVFILRFEQAPQEKAIIDQVSDKAATSSAPDAIVADLKSQINSLAETVKSLKQAPPAPSPTPTPNPPAIKSTEVYDKALKASLNVFCYDRKANAYIFGSATIIHPEGYILTNGHLAVRFEDPNTDCLLRRGSPARNYAKAKVVWLPDQTPKIGGSEIPKNDVAILKITELMDKGALTANFEYFEINKNYTPKIGEKLYSLNYPSEFLGADTAVSNTNLVFTLGTVENFLTVDDDTSNAEGVYLKGELSTQHGSSGGVFLDTQKGEIVGLFVGLTEGKTTSERMQFMFLSSYIERILKEEKGIGLSEFLNSGL